MKKSQTPQARRALLTLLVCSLLSFVGRTSTVQTYTLPAYAVPSSTFTVTANSTPIPVSTIETPSKSGSSIYTHVAHFSASGTLSVVIDAGQAITSYSIHPTSFGLTGAVDGTTLTLSLSDTLCDPQPTYLIVRINSLEDLAVLVDPLETDEIPIIRKGI